MYDATIALFEISAAILAFLPLAGLYEYVLCPVWEKWNRRVK